MRLKRHEFYILKGKEVYNASHQEWSEYFNSHDRVVKQTKIDKITISTVFIGVDHNFDSYGPPSVFETMTFNAGEEYWSLYATWDKAIDGHNKIVDTIKTKHKAYLNRSKVTTVKMR